MQCWIFGVLPLLKCTSINSVNREVTHKSIDLIPPHHVISNPAPLELLLKTYVLKLHNRLNSSRFGNLSVIHQAFSMKYVYKANRLWASNLQPPAVALYTSASPCHRLPPSVGLAADSFDPPYSHALLTRVLLFRETNGVRQATLTTSSNTYKLTLAFMRTSPSLLLSQC